MIRLKFWANPPFFDKNLKLGIYVNEYVNIRIRSGDTLAPPQKRQGGGLNTKTTNIFRNNIDTKKWLQLKIILRQISYKMTLNTTYFMQPLPRGDDEAQILGQPCILW